MERILPEHADETWPQLNDPLLWLFFPSLRPISKAALREWYERRAREHPGDQIWENWACRLRSSGKLVGEVQATIFASERVAYIAYMIYRVHQRQGFAREAAAAVVEHVRIEHGAMRVFAEMDVRNTASIRVAESLGFARVETRLCVERASAGELCDEYLYELDATTTRLPLLSETPAPPDTSQRP